MIQGVGNEGGGASRSKPSMKKRNSSSSENSGSSQSMADPANQKGWDIRGVSGSLSRAASGSRWFSVRKTCPPASRVRNRIFPPNPGQFAGAFADLFSRDHPGFEPPDRGGPDNKSFLKRLNKKAFVTS